MKTLGMFEIGALAPGAVLARRDGLIEHKAIYIGNGRVVHRVGKNRGGVIQEGRVSELVGQGFRFTVEREPVSDEHGQQNVDRALACVGLTGYDALFENCEHFVNWVYFGRKSSPQVQGAVALGVVIGLVCLAVRNDHAA